jgi:hypothetical protein
MRDFRRGSFLITFLMCVVFCPPLSVVLDWMFADSGLPIPGLGEIMLLTASLSLGICSLRISIDSKPEASAPAEKDHALPMTEQQAPPRLLQRLEPCLHGRLWSITVRDHYVDIRTEKGNVSLLMRFSDAMSEAEPEPGAQVHRSHWVAWDAVERVERDGAKMRLWLRSGDAVPVSRNHRGKVDERWPEEGVGPLESA